MPKIKDGAFLIINFDECKSIGTLYVNDNNVTYFDSFGVEHILKQIKKFIGKKNTIRNIYRMQAYNAIICKYFCIGFVDFMLKDERLLDNTNWFSSNDYEKYLTT